MPKKQNKTRKSGQRRTKGTGSFYVAFDPATGSDDIIASGSDVGKVIESARKKGIEVPAVMFVPEEGVTYIY